MIGFDVCYSVYVCYEGRMILQIKWTIIVIKKKRYERFGSLKVRLCYLHYKESAYLLSNSKNRKSDNPLYLTIFYPFMQGGIKNLRLRNLNRIADESTPAPVTGNPPQTPCQTSFTQHTLLGNGPPYAMAKCLCFVRNISGTLKDTKIRPYVLVS